MVDAVYRTKYGYDSRYIKAVLDDVNQVIRKDENDKNIKWNKFLDACYWYRVIASNGNTFKNDLYENNIHLLALEGMQMFPDISRVHSQSIELLAEMAKTANVAMSFSDKDVTGVVIKSMMDNPEDREIQSQGCKYIHELMKIEGNVPKLHAFHVDKLIKDVMKRFPDDSFPAKDDCFKVIDLLHQYKEKYDLDDYEPSDSKRTKLYDQDFKMWKMKGYEYELLEEIGQGSTGTVFKIRSMVDGKLYAFKKFNHSMFGPKELKEIKEEVNYLKNMVHENIVEFLGISLEPSTLDAKDNKLGVGILMEYCERGSLRQYLNENESISVDLIVRILLDIAKGIDYLHNRMHAPIVHKDIKTDNVLLDFSLKAKLADFGFAKTISSLKSTISGYSNKFVGTMCYMSPEAQRGLNSHTSSDIYSFGCLIYELLSGDRPWRDLLPTVIMHKVVVEKEKVDPKTVRPDAPKELVDLMMECMNYEPSDRPTIEMICNILQRLLSVAIYVDLSNEDEEFVKIEQLFFNPDYHLTSEHWGPKAYKVVEISKIYNAFTEKRYKAELEMVKVDMARLTDDSNPNEKLLFHGTRETNPKIIASHRDGLMKEFSAQGFFGKGLYFAEYAKYCNRGFAYRVGTAKRFQVLVFSVICGRSLNLGNNENEQTKFLSQKSPELKDYHSVLAGPRGDGSFSSHVYIVYKDTQVTPRYLITYDYILRS